MKIYCGGRTNGKTMKAIRLSVKKTNANNMLES